MAVAVGDLKFGETDAKNEVFQQTRYGSQVFFNSFQVPPRVDLNDLLLGARFFISGQKGCGKTALLLHVERILATTGANTHIVLFKSGLSETERSKLSAGQSVEVMQTGASFAVQYDYSINWLWFIYRNIIRLIDMKEVISGHEIAKDLKVLTGVMNETRTSNFSDLALNRVKGEAKAGLKGGPFSAELGLEVEAIRKVDADRFPSEVIEICERYLSKVKLAPRSRCLLFFDELELFWNRPDQRERDLFLIRDLLQSVSRVNRSLGLQSASFVVYASVRSEVLEEVNRVGPEIVRDITDFGVSVNWNVRASSAEQPILRIVEAKITASEIEADEMPTEDIWATYFPAEKVFGREIRDYMLDISMFKPRHIISLLTLAKSHNPTAFSLSVEAFEETTTDFSQTAWREIEEELLGRYTAKEVSNLKAILTGFKAKFKVSDLEERVHRLGSVEPSLVDGFRSRQSIVEACKLLYRVGAIGNSFYVPGSHGQSEKRNRWSFRDMGDPALDEWFNVHESLRKVFQLSFKE